MRTPVNGGVRIGPHSNKNAYMHEQTTTEVGVCIVDRKNLNLCTPFSAVSLWCTMATKIFTPASDIKHIDTLGTCIL